MAAHDQRRSREYIASARKFVFVGDFGKRERYYRKCLFCSDQHVQSAFSTLVSIMFAVIVLFNKQTVVKEGFYLMRAYLSKKRYAKTVHILSLIRNTFTSYIGGTCTECIILATLVMFFRFAIPDPFRVFGWDTCRDRRAHSNVWRFGGRDHRRSADRC